jgi:SAM-dependent methyltransferase
MRTTICPICNNLSVSRLEKKGVEYFLCLACDTLFSAPLENSNMIGGGNEEQRNVQQNAERIARFSTIIGGYKKEARVLDFGCGHGMLVKDLNKAGFVADGYDIFNDDYNWKLPQQDTYHLITMVEVIEHLSHPYVELNVIFRSLKHGGAVYIETSFTDVAHEENIELEDFFYIDPEVGHSTIFSHHGLDVLMMSKGFVPMQHANRHARIYQKK